MIIYEFQIFSGISSGGWGYAPIWHMGGVYPYMSPSIPPRVFVGTKKPHALFHRRGPYLIVHSSGAGNSFTMSHTATRASSWPYMNFKFVWRQFRGVGLCPYMAYGRGLPIYGSLHSSTGYWGD